MLQSSVRKYTPMDVSKTDQGEIPKTGSIFRIHWRENNGRRKRDLCQGRVSSTYVSSKITPEKARLLTLPFEKTHRPYCQQFGSFLAAAEAWITAPVISACRRQITESHTHYSSRTERTCCGKSSKSDIKSRSHVKTRKYYSTRLNQSDETICIRISVAFEWNTLYLEFDGVIDVVRFDPQIIDPQVRKCLHISCIKFNGLA